MSAQQDIQQCIQECQQTADKLRSMGDSETDQNKKMALHEAAHHLHLCISECQFAVQHAQS